MIVWIASYPRSGNTLTRIILYRCFGIEVKSLDPAAGVMVGKLKKFVGRRDLPEGMTPKEFVPFARASAETWFVKTHALPSEADPAGPLSGDSAIVILRDGRASMLSYWHFQNDIGGRPFPLEQIVIGAPPLVNWSEHVQRWQGHKGRLLMLRYEDLCAANAETIATIGEFIGKEARAAFDIQFSELHAELPNFFRAGRDQPGIAEVERRCPALFWSLHGKVMSELGYGGKERRDFSQTLAKAALKEAGLALHRQSHALSQVKARTQTS
jgi:hypothetical protein